MENLTILSDGLDREQWLAARRGIITATQVTAIAGSSPYAKLIDVWREHTDPGFVPEPIPKTMQPRIDLGHEREEAIIEWAAERTGLPFKPSKALVASIEHPTHAATPDGFAQTKDGKMLILVECKTTSQDWATDGLPQHVYDQCQWQMHVTGASAVYVAMERYEWLKGQSTFLSDFLLRVEPDANRLDFLLSRVAQFDKWMADGIAPESDVSLTIEPEIGFDTDEATAAAQAQDFAERHAIDLALSELADVRASLADGLKRQAELEGIVKAAVKQYDGRRVHLIGSKMVAKLIRGTKTVRDIDALPADVLASITSWSETETVRIESL